MTMAKSETDRKIIDFLLKYVEVYDVKKTVEKISCEWEKKTGSPLSEEIRKELKKGMLEGLCHCKFALQSSSEFYNPLITCMISMYDNADIDLLDGEIVEIPSFFALSSGSYAVLEEKKPEFLEFVDDLFDQRGIIA